MFKISAISWSVRAKSKLLFLSCFCYWLDVTISNKLQPIEIFLYTLVYSIIIFQKLNVY